MRRTSIRGHTILHRQPSQTVKHLNFSLTLTLTPRLIPRLQIVQLVNR